MPSFIGSARILATAGTVAAVSLVGSSAATARDSYPGKVEKKFVSQCVAAGKKKASSDVSTADLTAACKYTLTCIEGKLSYKDFKSASGDDPAVKQCIKKTKKHFSN